MNNPFNAKPSTLIVLVTVISLFFTVACGSSAESPAEPSAGAQPTQPAAAADAAPSSPSDSAPAQSGMASQSSGQMADPAPAPTAEPAAVGEAPASAPQSDAPSGTLRIALDEIGPPRWIPSLQGAPQNSINNTTFGESIWAKAPDGSLKECCWIRGKFPKMAPSGR